MVIKMKVPFMDLNQQYQSIQNEIMSAIASVFSSSSFILGPSVEAFEKKFAEYCGKKYAVGLNSGTAALQLALISKGIGGGDEVILPVNTFIATAYAVNHAGAKPVFVDINESTYHIDPDKIEGNININTRAIIPVHLYGQPANMNSVESIACGNGLFLLEDACQAHGARYHGKRVPVTETGAFSFYPSKNLGACGEAGMIVTDNEYVFKSVRALRDQGQEVKSCHNHLGFNERMDGLQGAVLGVKLYYLDDWTKKRRYNAELYNKYLEDVVGIPFQDLSSEHVFHLYVVRADRRDDLQRHLSEKGISSGIHYPTPIHLQPVFAHLGYSEGDFPVAEKASKEILSLPMYPELEESQIKYVCDAIKEFYKR